MIHLFLKTKKFIPNEYHDTFFDIDFVKLYKAGYRLILTDLDNTLISYEEDLPDKEILNKFDELKNLGFEVIIISNNHPPRIRKFIKETNIKGLGDARKPLAIGLKKAMKIAKDRPPKDVTMFIGDQLMTDVYGGNRFGIYTILVDPIKRKTEKWYTRLNRRIEVKMLNKIKNKYSDTYKTLNLEKRR
ncbi:MAG: YqeG family HAD IIIA-type phosphatase [Candidatus Izemoplasma sp.]